MIGIAVVLLLAVAAVFVLTVAMDWLAELVAPPAVASSRYRVHGPVDDTL